MYSDEMKKKEYKFYTIGIGVLLLLITIFFCIQTVNAAPDDIFNMSVFNKGDNYIQWSYYDDDAITTASYDGVTITDFDVKSLNFTASDLTPNSYHTFCAYSFDDFKCLMTNTTITKTNETLFWDYILLYLIFFIGLICLVVGIYEPIIAFAAFVFGCIGIITTSGLSFVMGVLFFLLIIASIFIAFRRN